VESEYPVEYDLGAMPSNDAYRLLTGLIVPRPIALVTSVGASGVVNAAPFSFFNMVGSNPPIVAVGVGNKRSGEPKDTAANVARTGEFIVQIVDEAIADRMNITAIEFPAEVSEPLQAGFTLTDGVRVAVPRLQEAPVHLECRLAQYVTIGDNHILLGEVVHVHVRDGETPDTLRQIARMGGGGGYLRTTDRFQMPRITLTEWSARNPTE
jgi:flavin reductase (DIM6/NTAB) family NADH-FMN oxidoreductase RutF